MSQLSRRSMVAVLSGGVLVSAVATRLVLDGWSSRPAQVTRGRGADTAFGSVAVLGSHRSRRERMAAHEHAGAAAHDRSWPDVVRVDVEVHNGRRRPVLMSPGQFRLRVGRDGPTVTPYAAGRVPGALGPRSTTRTWIDYLAPGDASDLWVEYAEAGAATLLAVPLRPDGSRPDPSRPDPSAGGDHGQHHQSGKATT